MWLDRVRDFINRDKIYAAMLIAVIFAAIFSVGVPSKPAKGALRADNLVVQEDLSAHKREAQGDFKAESVFTLIAAAIMILGALAFLTGFAIGLKALIFKISGHGWMASYGFIKDISWGLRDIFKVGIIFFFVGYTLRFGEAFMIFLSGVKDIDEKIFIVINVMIMDIAVIAAILYFVIKKYRSPLETIGVSLRGLARDIKIGLSGYLAILPVLTLVVITVIIILSALGYERPSSAVYDILFDTGRPKLLSLFLFIVVFSGPVAEELFFRGFSYPVVRKRLGVRRAIIVVSLIFSALHMSLVGFFPIFILGVLLAYLYEKTGSIVPSITVHVLHNAAVTFLFYLNNMTIFSR